jgi:stearoyl-CoA desaturase (Delta-9 desaturase)
MIEKTPTLENRSPIKFTINGMGFVLIHLLPLLALLPGITVTFFDWMLCIFLYFGRMVFVTGVYHRYFSHKTFKTSRVFQFILAFIAQTSVQKGVLWWAAHHRIHHKTSDTPQDPHSMKLYGFWYSHVGWILGPDYNETHYELIQDYAKYKEIVWLNKNHTIPPLVLAIVVFFLGAKVNGGSFLDYQAGLSTLLIGFFLSTAILFHGTFTINSVTHYFGKKRYETGDESRNSLFFALLTLGEGWHNNHHYYPSSNRNGFFWWEIDITFYFFKMLSFLGLVWDIQGVPDHIKYSKNLEDAKRLLNESKTANA